MQLQLGGFWYEFRKSDTMTAKGYVHHESGKAVVCPGTYRELQEARGDIPKLKQILFGLTPVDLAILRDKDLPGLITKALKDVNNGPDNKTIAGQSRT